MLMTPTPEESKLIKKTVELSELLRIDLSSVECRSSRPAFLLKKEQLKIDTNLNLQHKKINSELFVCHVQAIVKGEEIPKEKGKEMPKEKGKEIPNESKPLIYFKIRYSVLFHIKEDMSEKDLKPFTKFNVTFITHNYLRNTLDDLSRKMGFTIPITLPLIKRDKI